MPSPEWCKTVDAALANPHTEPATREEYIAAGQAHHCPHQMLLPPQKKKEVAAPRTPQQWCEEMFKVLANPRADQFLKATVLEKARNRGCLR